MPSQRRVRWGSAGQSVLPHGSSSVLALVAVIVALAHCQVAFAATAVIESPATVTAYPAAYATVRFTGASAVVTELVNVTVIGGGTALNSTVVAGNGLDALVEVHLEPTAAAIVLITVPVDASSPPLEKEVSLAITYQQCPANSQAVAGYCWKGDSQQFMDFNAAVATCSAMGDGFAVASMHRVQDEEVYAQYCGEVGCFLSAAYQESSNEWVNTDGSALDYSPWSSEPAPTSGHCSVAVPADTRSSSFAWQNVNCTTQWGVVCKTANPVCSNGKKDGWPHFELDVDCGGPCEPCACAGGFASNGVCYTPSPSPTKLSFSSAANTGCASAIAAPNCYRDAAFVLEHYSTLCRSADTCWVGFESGDGPTTWTSVAAEAELFFYNFTTPPVATSACAYLTREGSWGEAVDCQSTQRAYMCQDTIATCTNKLQDAMSPFFEEGIDCGGVCGPCVKLEVIPQPPVQLLNNVYVTHEPNISMAVRFSHDVCGVGLGMLSFDGNLGLKTAGYTFTWTPVLESRNYFLDVQVPKGVQSWLNTTFLSTGVSELLVPPLPASVYVPIKYQPLLATMVVEGLQEGPYTSDTTLVVAVVFTLAPTGLKSSSLQYTAPPHGARVMSVSLVQVYPWRFQFIVSLDPAQPGELTLTLPRYTVGGEDTLSPPLQEVAKRSIEYVPAIGVASATWAASLAYFTVKLTGPVTFGVIRHHGDCSKTVGSSSLTELGTNPSCLWGALDSVTITPGTGATLAINTVLDLSSNLNLTDSGGNTYSISGTTASLTSPRDVMPVTMSLVAQSAVGPCSVVVLDASSSVSPSGRPLVFAWQVLSATPATSLVALRLFLGDVPDNEPVVSVPSDMLTAGVEYVFEVSGVDFAGRGGTANTTVSVSLLPTPKVELLVPSKLTVYRAQATELRVTASAATGCSGVAASYNIKYSWTQTAGDALSLPSTSVDKRVATIPALTLQVGSTYTFRCTVSMVSNPSLSAYVDVHIVSVLSSPLRPVVAPLAAESAINQPLALDARASQDPDSEPGSATWQWACSIVGSSTPCTYGNGTVVQLPANEVSTIASNELSLDMVGTEVQFTLTYGKGARTSTARVTTVLVAQPPVVTASLAVLDEDGNLVSGKANPSAALVLKAEVRVDASQRRRLLMVGGGSGVYEGNDATGVAPTHRRHGRSLLSKEEEDFVRYKWEPVGNTVDFAKPGALATSSSNQYLVVNPGFLAPGVTYGFRLTAAAVDQHEQVLATSTTVGHVTLNAAPVPGDLVVSPDNGVEIATLFTLQASGWTDDPLDLPLRYRFGVAVGERPREAQVWYDDAAADATAYQASDYIPLAPALLANRYTTQLPAGDVNNGYTATVRVVVTDIFAASTQIATWVNVTRIIKADTQEELDTVVDTYTTTIEQTLAEGATEKTAVIVGALTDVVNKVSSIPPTDNVAVLPCYGTNQGVSANSARSNLITALKTLGTASAIDGENAAQHLLLNARLTATPGQLTAASSSAALSISKRATASLPKSSFLSEVSAVAAATTMSNIVTAQNRLLQSGRPTTTTTPLRDIGTVLESCSCSVNAAGVRSCSCPDASPAEQTAVSAWLEVAEVMNSVSSLRLANKAPDEPPSIVGSCRIDMQSYRRTLNTLASTSVALTSTKQPSNLVANVQLPEIVSAGLQALGLPPTTDPNSVIMDYRLIRWVDDPLQFADNGNDAAVASQVVTVDLVNSSGSVIGVSGLSSPLRMKIPWQIGQRPGVDIFVDNTTRQHTCTANDVATGYVNHTSTCGGLAFSFVVDCKTTGATVSYKCPTNTSDAVPACTYWQDSSSGDSTWARDGCTLEYATNTHIVCACTHLTDFAGAWVQLGDRSGDVLGFTGDVTLANVAENAVLVATIAVMLVISVALTFVASKLDKVDPPPLLLASTKDPALNRTTLSKLTHLPARRTMLQAFGSAAAMAANVAVNAAAAGAAAAAGVGTAGAGAMALQSDDDDDSVHSYQPGHANALTPAGAGVGTRGSHRAGDAAANGAWSPQHADMTKSGRAIWEGVPVEEHSWKVRLMGHWSVFVDLLRHRHPWCSLSSRKGTLGRVERVLLLVLAVFVSMWVLALQYDTDIDKEESDESFSVTATTILTNGFVAACINLPVQKLLAALMLRLGSERRPVRRLTSPEIMLQQAAAQAWKEVQQEQRAKANAQTKCCACCRRTNADNNVQSMQQHGEPHGGDDTYHAVSVSGANESQRHDYAVPVRPQHELADSFATVGCFRKRVFKALIPPSPSDLSRRRNPLLWAIIAYTAVAAVVLFCAFFVMIFGFRFGSEVSNAFLLSFVVSLLFGGFVVQPVAIVVLSFLKYRVFASFIAHVVPGFHAHDHYHFERVMLNDGPSTALAAILVANSRRSINDSQMMWDDDDDGSDKATSGVHGKPSQRHLGKSAPAVARAMPSGRSPVAAASMVSAADVVAVNVSADSDGSDGASSPRSASGHEPRPSLGDGHGVTLRTGATAEELDIGSLPSVTDEPADTALDAQQQQQQQGDDNLRAAAAAGFHDAADSDADADANSVASDVGPTPPTAPVGGIMSPMPAPNGGGAEVGASTRRTDRAFP